LPWRSVGENHHLPGAAAECTPFGRVLAAYAAGLAGRETDPESDDHVSFSIDQLQFDEALKRRIKAARFPTSKGDCQEFRVWPERLNLFMPLPG
jgi:hypothetical protein